MLALGSVATRSRGSLKVARMWLVKVPGAKQLAIGVVPEVAANSSTATWPLFPEMTLPSAGFSTATIA